MFLDGKRKTEKILLGENRNIGKYSLMKKETEKILLGEKQTPKNTH